MTDMTRDPFEARLTAALNDYVANARDPRPSSEIADVAMRPRGISARLSGTRSRRLLLLGVAAALLVPTAYFGARLLLPPSPVVENHVPAGNWRAIVVRRTYTEPGVAIFAIGADGAEKLLRAVPDTVLPAGLTLAEYGSVSETGWIALGEQQRPWNLVLVDLRDPNSVPWIVPGTSLGGVSPAWGPQGLIAAPLDLSNVWIIDPESRTRIRSIHGGLIGGGPSIHWTKDGTGLVDDRGTWGVIPIDGGPFVAGVPEVYHSSGASYGDHAANLRVCTVGGDCQVADGSVELAQPDGTVTKVFQQSGPDRASGASFGSKPGEYLIQVDADAGRRIVIDRVSGPSDEQIVALDRPLAWRFFWLSGLAPDDSFATFSVDLGNDTYGIALAPTGGGVASYHHASMAGYLSAAIADAIGTTGYDLSAADPLGARATAPFPLPPINDLIAAETRLNPGHTLVGQGSHDAVDGDPAVEEYQVTALVTGNLDVYLDCFGAAPVTVRHGSNSITSPCTLVGGYIATFDNILAGDVVTVSASHDTSWRVTLYTFDQAQFEGTPPPVPAPADTPAP